MIAAAVAPALALWTYRIGLTTRQQAVDLALAVGVAQLFVWGLAVGRALGRGWLVAFGWRWWTSPWAGDRRPQDARPALRATVRGIERAPGTGALRRLTGWCGYAGRWRSPEPTYFTSGRMRRLFAPCSMAWAVQPAWRASAKVAGNRSGVRPTPMRTGAA